MLQLYKAMAMIISSAALSGLLGCTTVKVREGVAPGVRVRDDNAPNARVCLNTVNIIDKSLQNWQGKNAEKGGKIAVEATNARRSESRTVEVWATLRNRTDFPLQIEARTQFFGPDRSPLEGPTSWQRLFLPPNAVATYKEYSTRVSEVGFYYVEIREGR